MEPNADCYVWPTMLIFLLVQAAVQSPPDIQLDIRASARRVTIEQKGEASLEVRADPDGGSTVTVDAPDSQGRRTLRNVDVRVRAEADIADPLEDRAEPSVRPKQ